MTSSAPEYLDDLERETWLKMMSPQMVTGKLGGRFLSFLSRIKNPGRILEIGTFTGYGTLCLWEGLKADGKITTIEINPECQWLAEKYFRQAEARDQINFIPGDALRIIPDLREYYDLVFIDAAKPDNQVYLKYVLDKVRPGALIVTDNTLWSGKVLNDDQDVVTQSVVEFNKTLKDHTRLQSTLIPIRDGMTLSIVK